MRVSPAGKRERERVIKREGSGEKERERERERETKYVCQEGGRELYNLNKYENQRQSKS